MTRKLGPYFLDFVTDFFNLKVREKQGKKSFKVGPREKLLGNRSRWPKMINISLAGDESDRINY